MKLLIAFAIVTAVVALYVVVVRPWLCNQPWAKGFFLWIEPFEIALWKKSETILWARFKMAVGALLTCLTMLGTIDLTPLMPFVPDQYEALVKGLVNLSPLAITVLGWIDEKLRKDTTRPLEVVAAPEAVKQALPEIKQAEVANIEAVAAVEVAKVQGVA